MDQEVVSDPDNARAAGDGHWPQSGKVLYGGDYNPEQWPRKVWQEDARLMGEAGVNLVTVGIWSWAHLEPTEGSVRLRLAEDRARPDGRSGYRGRPRNPDRSPTTLADHSLPRCAASGRAGIALQPGKPAALLCLQPHITGAWRTASSSDWRTELGGHPAVRMWHVHNEYACHVPYCYCDHHAVSFRSWLERRYGSVGSLNDAWGTAFWSQRYSDFAEVLPPR